MKRLTLELAEAKALETTLAGAVEELHEGAADGGTPNAIMADLLTGILAKLQTPTP